MRTQPIQMSDGVYLRVVEPMLGVVTDRAEQAIRVAQGNNGDTVMIFNGTSVYVYPEDTVESVCQRWRDHRANYQLGL